MLDIDQDFMYHKLVILPQAKPIAQRKRKLNDERHLATKHEVSQLLKANFTKEITYTMWLANVVLVKKIKWQVVDVN